MLHSLAEPLSRKTNAHIFTPIPTRHFCSLVGLRHLGSPSVLDDFRGRGTATRCKMLFRFSRQWHGHVLAGWVVLTGGGILATEWWKMMSCGLISL